MMDGQLKNGTILTSECGNKYKVSCLLGAGGQGEVYDVVCDGQHYALKWYFKGSATQRQKKILETIIFTKRRSTIIVYGYIHKITLVIIIVSTSNQGCPTHGTLTSTSSSHTRIRH